MKLSPASLPPDSVLVDEVGIETGVWGKFRLKSAYQPVFRLEGDMLTRFAVEARTLPCLEGNAVPPALFHAAVPVVDRALLGRLGRTIAIGNLDNTGQPGLALLQRLEVDDHADLAALTDEVAGLATRLAEAGHPPATAIVMFRGDSIGEDDAGALAVAIRGHGMRVCLQESGPLFSAPALLAAAAPDFLRLSAERIRMLADEAPVLRMLQAMHATLRERGIETLATGIETPDDFAATLSAGLSCFQGVYLARPVLAGSLLGASPLPVGTLRGGRDNVVSLFGQAG